MTRPTDTTWLHRFAVLTVCAAVLPIVVGAVVTTVGAGMAFADWPSSDGHNMLTYPWLQSEGDKFVEHGHRLAGMLIGVLSIMLVVLAWRSEPRNWVRWLSVTILLAVIAQGLLGGSRVLWDRRTLALVHGGFAACVFALMASMALVTSRFWRQSERPTRNYDRSALVPLAVLTPLVIAGQYGMGGLVRHLGTALHEHLAGAVLVLIFVLAAGFKAIRSGQPALRRSGLWLLLLLLSQTLLGAATWVTRFGWPRTGYVSVQHAPLQIVVRTSHTVLGLLLFTTAVIYLLKILRLGYLQSRHEQTGPGHPILVAGNGSLSVEGGVG